MAIALDDYAPFPTGIGKDRSEAGWRNFQKAIGLSSGPLRGVLDEFEVYGDSSGMFIKTKSGECALEGHWGQSSAEKVQSINDGDATNDRIDRVILRVYFTAEDLIEIDILEGTPAASPSAPALTQSTAKWEIALGQVYVIAGESTTIAASSSGGTVSGFHLDERTWAVAPGGIHTSFTPTLYQNGVQIATSEAIGEYWIRGDHCDLWMSLTASGTGTGATFIETKSIPAAITPVHFSGTRGKYLHGVASYHTVANTNHQGVGQFNTATSMGFLMNDSIGNWFGITPIIAVAVGEVLSFTGSYRIA